VSCLQQPAYASHSEIFQYCPQNYTQLVFDGVFLQRVIEGKIKGGIEVTGIRGRKLRKLLDDLKEKR
jgi:hypothetical protein